ncbi:MAG: RNA polymerase subunit sigma [Leptospiraceae bacterium]|nr:MAG: RNA polymerase subunit sigma [Leptospiraceae bacterium]
MTQTFHKNQSIEEILDEYNKKLKQYLIHLLPYTDENVINDLLQDILIKIYTHKNYIKNKMIEPDFNLNAYLYQMARNYVIDYQRKLKKNKEIQETELIDFNIDSISKEKDNIKNFLVNYDWTSEEEEMLKKESFECLYYQMNKLKFEYREILYLYYFENFSLQDIAKKLQINYGTASMRLQRARYRLRKIIQSTCCIIQSKNNIYLSCKNSEESEICEYKN